MPQVVLLGDPVAHSFSPAFQNAGFAARGMLDWSYRAQRVDVAGLGDAVRRIRIGEYVGANVTIPHKEAVVARLDALTPIARAVGAVNTIYRHAGRVWGDNTDVVGVAATLDALGFDDGADVLVLGAGGAARAAVRACVTRANRVTVVNRTLANARRIAMDALQWPDHHCAIGALLWSTDRQSRDDLSEAMTAADVIINSVPDNASTHAALTALPWGQAHPLATAFDLSYGSGGTRFCQLARKAGMRSVDGALMLLRQGTAAWQIWTGEPAPEWEMECALRQSTGRSALLDW